MCACAYVCLVLGYEHETRCVCVCVLSWAMRISRSICIHETTKYNTNLAQPTSAIARSQGEPDIPQFVFCVGEAQAHCVRWVVYPGPPLHHCNQVYSFQRVHVSLRIDLKHVQLLTKTSRYFVQAKLKHIVFGGSFICYHPYTIANISSAKREHVRLYTYRKHMQLMRFTSRYFLYRRSSSTLCSVGRLSGTTPTRSLRFRRLCASTLEGRCRRCF